MQRLRTFAALPIVLWLAVWLACLTGHCESLREGRADKTAASGATVNTVKTGGDLRRRKARTDCDELRMMFVEKGCIQEDSRRCKLLGFRLQGGKLSKRPRCAFMPCERYGQPANQTCESHCLGTPVPGGLCETGGVGGSVDSESVLRSARTILLLVRAPPLARWPDGGPEITILWTGYVHTTNPCSKNS
ncbi:hypothetical protein PoB_003110900 [Plakobranchus ocellatus]|uniref:Secreted protein n=1 Tax=Plakobranchus ocellatus TaxID=259542 RepID=A0AAV4AED1_9GAST|nr:hypothetical protein PoB_003110900 [Plakobranchus ocellatus]